MRKLLPAIAVLYLIVYILPLGVRPAMIPDETRYGEISREMIATGDYTVPHLEGVRYFEKPVLGYWLNALSIHVFGDNAFAIRFPSAVSAGLSALFVFIFAYALGAGTSVGILAAAICLTFLEVFGIGVYSVLDSMFSMFVTASMVTFLLAYTADLKSRKRFLLLALFGLLCGLAFLVKGFLAFAIPVVVIGPFLIWEKRPKDILRLPWIPIFVAIVVSLPWAIDIWFKDPDFWHFFIFNEHIRRFMEANAQHTEPFWYYIPALILGALPWTFVSPAAISGIIKKGTGNTMVRYLLCWFIFPFIFFSISKGKIATYILPCFPALALLFAIGLTTYFKEKDGKLFSAGAYGMAGLAVVLAVVLAVFQTVAPPQIKPYEEIWKWIFAESGFLLWAVLSYRAGRAIEWPRKAALFSLAPVLFLFCSHFVVPAPVIKNKAPGAFLLSHKAMVQPDTVLVSESSVAPAVSWYYKRTGIYLFKSAGEMAYGFSYPDAQSRFIQNNERFSELIRRHRASGGVVFITKKNEYADMRKALPPPTYVATKGNFVFVRF